MQYFLDVSLIAIVAVTVVLYWRKGLLRSLMGVAKAILTLAFTYMFGDKVAFWLHETYMQPAVNGFVQKRLQELFSSGETNFDISSVLENIPPWLSGMLENFQVDLSVLQQKYSDITEGSSEQLSMLAADIATPVSDLISSALGYSGVFLASGLLLTIAAFLLSKVADLPIIRRFDRILGLFLGLFCAVLYGSLWVIVVHALLGWWEVSDPSMAYGAAFDVTWVFRHAYEYNIFGLLFGI